MAVIQRRRLHVRGRDHRAVDLHVRDRPDSAASDRPDLSAASFFVPPRLDGARVDVAIAAEVATLSRTQAGRLAAGGAVLVDGATVRAAARVRAGARVEVELADPAAASHQAEPIPLEIVHRDDAILVVAKPAGLVVHPAPGHPRGTLVNALLAIDPGLSVGLAERPGIVHRLDRDTSGLMVVARTDRAMRHLRAQWAERTVMKVYLALVRGRLASPAAAIEAPIGRDPRDRKRMAIAADGRPATTGFQVLREVGGHSLLEVRIETGRTHQIRVHLASIGHPVVADTLYGGPPLPGLGRHFLHAARLGFRHPDDDRWIELAAPLPGDLSSALQRLESAP